MRLSSSVTALFLSLEEDEECQQEKSAGSHSIIHEECFNEKASVRFRGFENTKPFPSLTETNKHMKS